MCSSTIADAPNVMCKIGQSLKGSQTDKVQLNTADLKCVPTYAHADLTANQHTLCVSGSSQTADTTAIVYS